MTDHCSDCGAELIEGSKFCTACGKNVEQQPETPVQPQEQQPVEKKQTSAPPKTKKKPKKKLLIGLLAIIVVAVIIVIIAIYLQGGTGPLGNADSRFVGEWEQQTIGSPILWKFNSNSILEKESPGNNTGTWKVTNSQICLYNEVVCYTYEFSNDGNILTLNRIGQNDSYSANIFLTKKGLVGSSEKPAIECLVDAATNRIIIDSVDANVKWSDIEITTNANATWQVQDINKKGLARIGITNTITTFITSGDSILLLETTGDVTVTLKFKPTNEILGNWTVNV
jgi:zinc-ribbon domain